MQHKQVGVGLLLYFLEMLKEIIRLTKKDMIMAHLPKSWLIDQDSRIRGVKGSSEKH